jgi:hypothetical protein
MNNVEDSFLGEDADKQAFSISPSLYHVLPSTAFIHSLSRFLSTNVERWNERPVSPERKHLIKLTLIGEINGGARRYPEMHNERRVSILKKRVKKRETYRQTEREGETRRRS